MAATELEPRPDQVEAPLRDALGERPPVARVLAVVVVAYVATTAVLIGVGALVVGLGVDSWFGDIDQSLTEWAADNRTAAADAVSANLSNLADTFTVVGVACGAGVILLVLRCHRQVVVLVVALPLELVVFLSVGYTIGRPRPEVAALDALPATASFPSGHAAAAIALYGSMAVIVRSLSTSERVQRWAVVVTAVIAAGVALSRVYRGLHHPSDVVAGVALGLAALTGAIVAARLIDDDPR